MEKGQAYYYRVFSLRSMQKLQWSIVHCRLLTECKNFSFVFVLISLTSLGHTRKIERIWAVKRG